MLFGLVLIGPMTYIFRKPLEREIDDFINCRSYYSNFYKNYSKDSFSQYCIDNINNIDNLSWFTDPSNKNYILLIGFAGLCLLNVSANGFYYKNYYHKYKYRYDTKKKLVFHSRVNTLFANPFISKDNCESFSLLPLESKIIEQASFSLLPPKSQVTDQAPFINYEIRLTTRPNNILNYSSLHNNLDSDMLCSSVSSNRSNDIISTKKISNPFNKFSQANISNFESPTSNKSIVSRFNSLKKVTILLSETYSSKESFKKRKKFFSRSISKLSYNNVTFGNVSSYSSMDYMVSPRLLRTPKKFKSAHYRNFLNNSYSYKKHITEGGVGGGITKFVIGESFNGSYSKKSIDWSMSSHRSNSHLRFKANTYPKHSVVLESFRSSNSRSINSEDRNNSKIINFSKLFRAKKIIKIIRFDLQKNKSTNI